MARREDEERGNPGKRLGRQKGAQAHAEGQHGSKTHQRFIEQLHEGRHREREDVPRERQQVEAAWQGKRRLVEDRQQHDEAEKNSERTRLHMEYDRGRAVGPSDNRGSLHGPLGSDHRADFQAHDRHGLHLPQRKVRARATAGAPEGSTIPTRMRAAAVDQFGPPELVTLHTLAVPQPAPREVLIRVRAAGVGIWDTKIRAGTWASGDERFPWVSGTDGAGVVVARGSRVRRFKVGDRVWAYSFNNPKGGFFAEYVAVDMDHVARIPGRLGMVEAGASVVTGLTALQGVDDALATKDGQSILIFGASGAVGTLALQFAKHRGAMIIATATGGDAQRTVRDLGADVVLDGRAADFVEQLLRIVPTGVDGALALAGSDVWQRARQFVRDGGRIAHPNGVEPPPPTNPGYRVIAYDAEVGRKPLEKLERAVAESDLRVVVAGEYPLEQAAGAHSRIEEGRVIGRLVIRIGDESGEPER